MTTHHASRWAIVALLFLSVCINYVDRGSLSVAAPILADEFSLSPRRLGYLLSSFFWSYTALQFVVAGAVGALDAERSRAGEAGATWRTRNVGDPGSARNLGHFARDVLSGLRLGFPVDLDAVVPG